MFSLAMIQKHHHNFLRKKIHKASRGQLIANTVTTLFGKLQKK